MVLSFHFLIHFRLLIKSGTGGKGQDIRYSAPPFPLDSAMLVVIQALIVPFCACNRDLGTSMTMLITLVPAKVSIPGLLKLVAIPPVMRWNWSRSKKNGSSRGP